VTSESTQPAAGEAGKPDKAPKSKDAGVSADLRPVLDAIAKMQAEVVGLRAEVADLRAENAALRVVAEAGASAAAEASAYMRVLLPEQYLALKPDEVRQLHVAAPEARLKLTADFISTMVTIRRGEVIEAGDPRIPMYADRMQLALVVGGEDAGERVEQLVGQANARHVKALVENKRREQQRIAEQHAAQAREAEARAKSLAVEAA
jgi:hypothetical protein